MHFVEKYSYDEAKTQHYHVKENQPWKTKLLLTAVFEPTPGLISIDQKRLSYNSIN